MSRPELDDDLPPPWVQFPGTDPTWGGWRQGVSEAWLRERFLPFWKSQSSEQRRDYLNRWPPPDDLWGTYLTKYWI